MVLFFLSKISSFKVKLPKVQIYMSQLFIVMNLTCKRLIVTFFQPKISDEMIN